MEETIDSSSERVYIAPTREEELERFREAWRAEVRRKKETSSTTSGPSEDSQRPPSNADELYWGPSTSSAELDLALQKLSVTPTPKSLPVTSSSPPHASTSRAIDLYRTAVECEQEGRLDDALALYRRSFKLDSNVDKAYHRLISRESPATHSRHTDEHTQKDVAAHTASAQTEQPERAKESLQQMLSTFQPRPVVFTAEDERLPNPLSTLPDEVILHILLLLALQKDVTSIERFAMVNLKARLLAADHSVWRFICETTYVPPQIKQGLSASDIVGRYANDYRHTFIHHPRVRLDGCYIAVCHYIRPGQSENAWVTIRHLITYHRLLRFYPDGTVVSLLTNEEKPLAEMVHLLKPSIRIKGSQVGRWSLDDTDRRLSIRHLRPIEPGGRSTLKYEFAMDLRLTSARHMRWNKLDMQWYASVDIESGEVQELPIKRERPFYFSKVKSYVV